jgi:hypothetical protein
MGLVTKIEGDSENIAGAIQQENSSAISKVRSLFVDPGFPALPDADAGIAGPTEELPNDKPLRRS